MTKEKCFIIAPISTPEDRRPLYLNDPKHCQHVIDYLLVPAIENAGFDPVSPLAKAADLIHAEVVRNLQTATLVLCDMSGLNPNVMFELGVRTAMNKPVCLIIDEVTPKPPFDLNLINHHRYVPDLREWVLKPEIAKLTDHVRASSATSENALWKYFSLKAAADATDAKSGEQSELTLIRMQIEALRKDVTRSDDFFAEPQIISRPNRAALIEMKTRQLANIAGALGIKGTVRPKLMGDNTLEFWFEISGDDAPHPKLDDFLEIANVLGIKLKVEAQLSWQPESSKPAGR